MRRTVMTSGRTIMFSAVILVASSVPLLLFPQGFLKSITYAIIASVMLGGDPVDHRAGRRPGHPRSSRRFRRREDAGAVRPARSHPSDPANPRSNPLAIASIPAGILLPPVGIAFGHIARSRIRTTGERGAGLALIGLVLGYVSLMCALAYGVIALRDGGHRRRCAVLDPARHRDLRLGGHRRTRHRAGRAADPRPDRLVAELAGREDAEDQDARRGREGLLGQARQPRHEAPGAFARRSSSS